MQNTSLAGVLVSLLASFLFGVLYYYAVILDPLSGEEIFSCRVILTMPFITAFLLLRSKWDLVRQIFIRLRKQPLLILVLLISSFLMAIQFWLFMWAPINGHGLEVSLGYFLMPLVLVATGRLVYRDRISKLQTLACIFAALGVINEFTVVGHFAWPTFVVALGYPVYFVLRRHFGVNHLGGTWFDMALAIPVGLALLFRDGSFSAKLAEQPSLWGLILILGLLSAAGVACYIIASYMLSMTLFGLLSYVEPVLLVVVSIIIGDVISDAQWPTYIAIWGAVAILTLEGVLKVTQNRRQKI